MKLIRQTTEISEEGVTVVFTACKSDGKNFGVFKVLSEYSRILPQLYFICYVLVPLRNAMGR